MYMNFPIGAVIQRLDIALASVASALAIPATIIFFGAALSLTMITNFVQLRGLFCIKNRFKQSGTQTHSGTISPLKALFTSMASTLGMGNIIGPSVAVVVAGPGALFWMILYMIFAGAVKYTEVCFAVKTRERVASGQIVGGPMCYLAAVNATLAQWYAASALLLFVCWSSMQAHTLADILSFHGIPQLAVGVSLAIALYAVLQGGIVWVARVSSQLVPIMFICYFFSSIAIIFATGQPLGHILSLILQDALTVRAVAGGISGASIVRVMHIGMQRAVFITEAGLGTSSIAHALSSVSKPSDQGILAMYSMLSDIILSLLSGIVVIAAGFAHSGVLRNSIVYEAFAQFLPGWGPYIFIAIAVLFVFTTILGNSFNGAQIIALLWGHNAVVPYQLFGAIVVILGAIAPVRLLWNATDCLLLLVAIPNIVGIIYLALNDQQALRL